MKDFASLLLEDLEIQLNEIGIQKNLIIATEIAIKITTNVLDQLKSYVVKYKFADHIEEISFFKFVKPQFVSKLVYYNTIYNIESNRPFGGRKYIRKYYNVELSKLKCYFDENAAFYKYYRTGSVYLDGQYFVRGHCDIKLKLDSFYFQADDRFTTLHDFTIARIQANEQIQTYLEKEISILDSNTDPYNLTQRQIQKWTGSKIALIELIYALHAEGVFNNGRTDLKETAKFFEETFDIDLGQFHRTFFEMRARKSERTKFLNSLREGLIRRMDEVDE